MALRAGDRVRYSVERWRWGLIIRSDLTGARLLGRLLWGLSYQRRPDTVLVLDPGHLTGDPSHGGPSPAVVFGPSTGTVLTASTARALARPALWRTRPDGTVGWNTDRLPAERADRQAQREARRLGAPWPHSPDEPAARFVDAGGACAVLATPQTLRDWAVRITDAGGYWHHGESCTEPAYGQVAIDVHAVRHYHRLVSAAARARAEVLAAGGRPADPAELDRRVAAHTEAVAARRPGPWDPEPPLSLPA
jgi:hypothetical protein